MTVTDGHVNESFCSAHRSHVERNWSFGSEGDGKRVNVKVSSSVSQVMAMVSVRGLFFIITLFLGSFFGSVFMLGPVLPLMLLSPAWYRWITDRIVATWLTLPVVRLSSSSSLALGNGPPQTS